MLCIVYNAFVTAICLFAFGFNEPSSCSIFTKQKESTKKKIKNMIVFDFKVEEEGARTISLKELPLSRAVNWCSLVLDSESA